MKITLITSHRNRGNWVELRREDVTQIAHVTPKRIKIRLMTFARSDGSQIGWDFRSFYAHRIIESTEEVQP